MLVAYMAPDALTELKKGSAVTLVLAVLEDGTRHGYVLAKEIDRRSGGRQGRAARELARAGLMA